MLEINSVTKQYSKKTGIFDVSICIPKGQIVAFIGPNGSGKSTLFSIVGQVLKANSGVCKWCNIKLEELSISKFAFLPEEVYLLEEFTPLQMIDFMNSMKELNASSDEIHRIIRCFNIETFINKKIKNLSYGMKKRVALACTLLGNPELLILDEPINSLDLQSVISLKKILVEFKEKGTTILISSHILDFLDSIVDQVVFLNNGKIVEVFSNINEKVETLYCNRFQVN